MTIVYVILKVLAIIGVVLLSILALILLVLLTVLLVPVRYSARGSYIKDGGTPSFQAKGSWLLHILSVTFTYKADEPLSIRIFGFRILKSKKKKAEEVPSFEDDAPVVTDTSEKAGPSKAGSETGEEKPEEAKAELKIDEKAEEIIKESPSESESTVSGLPEEESREEIADDADIFEEAEDEPVFKEDEEEEVDPTEKDSHKSKKHVKIKRYIEIIRSDLFKEAFYDGKDILFKLLKHVLPRKWNINADLGFDDPATTGSILAAAGMLYPIIGNHVRINGYFDREVIDVNGSLKGHITLMRILILALFAFFNRKIRRLIKLFKEA